LVSEFDRYTPFVLLPTVQLAPNEWSNVDLLKTAHHCTCTVHAWLKTEDVKASISGI
jgi:hypothetical protein